MTRIILATLMACSLAAPLPAQKSGPETLLQTAIKREVVDGNLAGAIDAYKKALAGAKGNRAVAAMALVRMAGCYRKMGDAQAQKLYEEVMKDYADQKEAVVLAEAAMGTVSAAAGPTRKLVCAGSDCQGLLSPDGKSILRYAGPLEVMDVATHKTRELLETTPGTNQCCRRFSPDGSRIVFTERRPGTPPALGGVINLINSDGTGHRTLYRGGFAMAWSGDGKRLLVGKNPDGKPRNFVALLWVDAATGAAQELPTAHFNLDVAAVSPDGRYVAFNAGENKEAEENVYLMARDGSGETVLAPSGAYQEPVGWTPDSKYLLYSQYYHTSARLWAIAVVNGKPQGSPIDLHAQLDKTDFGMLPSGAVYYHSQAPDADIYTVALDAATGRLGSAPVLVPLARTGTNSLPRWAPDSRRVAYQTAHNATVNGRITEIRELSIYSFETAEEKHLAEQPRLAFPAYCWSGDGKSLLLNTMDSQNQPAAARYELADSRISPIFAGVPGFSIRSCSGDAVAGFTPSGTEAKIEVRSLSNGSARQIDTIATNAARMVTPLISHDGRSVAYFASSAAGTVLRVVPAGGGPARDIVTLDPQASIPEGWSLAWSADDRFIYFLQKSARLTQLFRIAATGGTPESLGLSGEELSSINTSPDGKQIAFVRGRLNRQELWELENYLPPAKR
ncbi:MAG TPA: hypothetical protein VN736_24735 [Candidatus Limnocylindrales bacterium]|nr:hypothetical protein [Candidatus Limnocylindrales bacterium]